MRSTRNIEVRFHSLPFLKASPINPLTPARPRYDRGRDPPLARLPVRFCPFRPSPRSLVRSSHLQSAAYQISWPRCSHPARTKRQRGARCQCTTDQRNTTSTRLVPRLRRRFPRFVFVNSLCLFLSLSLSLFDEANGGRYATGRPREQRTPSRGWSGKIVSSFATWARGLVLKEISMRD